MSPDPSIVLEMDAATTPFWEAAREHRFAMPKCAQCSRFHFPPLPFCPHCHGSEITFPALSGRGLIYTYTVIRTKEGPPKLVGLVEIPDADGCRIFSSFFDVEPHDIAIGMPVEVRWQEIADGWQFPRFAPVDR